MEKIIIYTDGGSRGNPGPAGMGVVIADGKGKMMKEYSGFLGVKTNNEAEYEAVIFGLKKIKAFLCKKKIKKKKYGGQKKFKKKRRKKKKEADRLTNEAMDNENSKLKIQNSKLF